MKSQWQTSSAGQVWGDPVEIEDHSSKNHLKININGESWEGELRLTESNRGFLTVKDQVYPVAWHADIQGIWITLAGRMVLFRKKSRQSLDSSSENNLASPMPAKVIQILVSQGDQVCKDDPLIQLEAMKMEQVLKAPRDGVVKAIKVAQGDQVDSGIPLVELE